MSDKIETVKVVTDNDEGYKIINKSDMQKEDKIFSADKPKKRGKK